MSKFHIHLVSDATGETVQSVARACMVQFADAEPQEHLWTLVRSERHLDEVIEGITNNPGLVLLTLIDQKACNKLQTACRRLNVPCHSVLDPIIAAFGNYLQSESRGLPGRQHVLDEDYFSRIDAMDFALAHDDGQGTRNLNEADIVLVGVSRTSKTPTCMYLANRGVKAANVPIVPDCPLPDELLSATKPLIVGLTKDPRRLVQIRRNRLQMLRQDGDTDYADPDTVTEEVMHAQKLFARQKWPVIDVTRRSIEETAAAILRHLAQHREQGT
jgi:regulator of PEP synthase PpsR (kinase-PPPase family)